MHYVDGFVAAVPTAKRDTYLEYAKVIAGIFKANGALKVTENWGDDVPEGKQTSFTMAVKREESEVVVFGWVEWPSKQARDAGWEKAMADPRMNPTNASMPFDGKRMIYGGFQIIMEA